MAKEKNRPHYIYALIILGLLFILQFAGVLKPVKSMAYTLFTPLISKIYNLDANSIFKESKTDLYARYQICLSEKQNNDYEKAQIEILKKDNEELKKQLGFKQNQKFKTIAASVISRALETGDQSLLLDIGTRDGVYPGQPVIVGNGTLIGKIIETQEKTSWVRLLSDNRSKIAGAILNSEQSIGVVEGGYGLSIKMNFIPRNELVKIGDFITTSGLEEGIPRGLIIGKIAALENEAYKPFQQAIITPAANLDKIYLVNVITER